MGLSRVVPPAAPSAEAALRLTHWAIVLAVVLLVLLGGVAFTTHSMLALAQASDSFADAFTGVVLLIAVRVGAEAPDDGHPFGHHGAQPIAALVVAVLTGVLAIEVMRAAIQGLLGGAHPTLSWPVLAVFVIKFGAKSIFAWAASRRRRTDLSPVVHALQVDAINDVAVSGLAIVGYFAARYGDSAVDAWLAIPVALWIGVAGVRLALDNVRLLMGEAPANDRLVALRASIESLAGVHGIVDLRARYHGTSIAVRATIVVDDSLTVGQARRIGDAAERALLASPDVSDVAIGVGAKE